MTHSRSRTRNGACGQARDAPFEQALAGRGLAPIEAGRPEVLQINVGMLCNQVCRHCHVQAGPGREEVMSRETLEACLEAATRAGIPEIDITGGAPEMNPHFRWLVTEARRRGRHVIDRSNLTILVAPGYEDLPELLAEEGVEVIASLPCYLAENTDSQRGAGVFERSIAALRRLNELGYGRLGGSLELSLVHNPTGVCLPPPEAALEEEYREELARRHGIVFNRLYTMCNMPIGRFREDLKATGRLETYMETLVKAFNPAAAGTVMCRTTISVGWDGRLYDCDFNQVLGLGLGLGPGLGLGHGPVLEARPPLHIRDFDEKLLRGRRIATGDHCFGCTAGQGSSCGGAVVQSFGSA